MSHKHALYSGGVLSLTVTSDTNLDNSVFAKLVSSSMNGTKLPFHTILRDVLVNIVCQFERVQNHLGVKPLDMVMWVFLEWASWVGIPTLNVGDIIL